jgi:serine/threonine protein kinase
MILKPENVLVSLKYLNTIDTLKITDFGVSKQGLSEPQCVVLISTVDQMQPNACTFTGTPQFMAPEVFNQNYSYPADSTIFYAFQTIIWLLVWSYGMVLYSLLTGESPRYNFMQVAKVNLQ